MDWEQAASAIIEGSPVGSQRYHRNGITADQLRAVAWKRGAMLIAEGDNQEQRVEPALAVLRGRLASAFVTDQEFARSLLLRHLRDVGSRNSNINGKAAGSNRPTPLSSALGG